MIHVIVPAIVDQEVSEAAVAGIRQNFCDVSSPNTFMIWACVDNHTRPSYSGTQQSVASLWSSLPATNVILPNRRIGLESSFKILADLAVQYSNEDDEILCIEDDTILQHPIPADHLIGMTKGGSRQARLSYTVLHNGSYRERGAWSNETPFLTGEKADEQHSGEFEVWKTHRKFCSTAGMIISRDVMQNSMRVYDKYAYQGPPEDRFGEMPCFPFEAVVLFRQGATATKIKSGWEIPPEKHYLYDNIRCQRDQVVNFRR